MTIEQKAPFAVRHGACDTVQWIDTHCHLDAMEFQSGGRDVHTVRARAALRSVAVCVLPSVNCGGFAAVERLAHAHGDGYALGIHPLFVPSADDRDLKSLDNALSARRGDPQLVALGEIGLDFFVPALCTPEMRAKQEYFYSAQLQLARKHGLPVVLHVRHSADRLLKYLRAVAGPGGRWHGIAHAFNGSRQQADAFISLGFKLGFGGAVTFARALQLRALASSLPLEALVLETDAPDMPPHWLYTTKQQRDAGVPQGCNEPGELPRIGSVVAGLRGMSVPDLAAATTANALAALPRLQALLPGGAPC